MTTTNHDAAILNLADRLLVYRKLLLPLLVLFAFSGFSSSTLGQSNVQNAIESTNQSGATTMDWISSIKDLMNILFFLVVGTLGVLSYRQAKKTIFTPLKTETFKLQLEVFKDILSFFHEFRNDMGVDNFDFQRIVLLNTSELVEDYATTFFKGRIILMNNGGEKERELEYAGGIYPLESVHVIDFEATNEKIIQSEEITDPATILSNWKSHKDRGVHFTHKYAAQVKKIDEYLSSPLVPEGLRNKLEKFTNGVQSNLSIVAKVINEVSKELPDKYPTIETLTEGNLLWVMNRFVLCREESGEDLKGVAKEIEDYIRDYLNIENLAQIGQ